MEARGAINCYEPYEDKIDDAAKPIFVINLSAGVTPMMHFFDKIEYASSCYRLPNVVSLTATYAWYRPTKVEFDALDKGMKDHVLNGGLCIAELAKARPLEDDPVEPNWEYEQFQEFCLKTYGARRAE